MVPGMIMLWHGTIANVPSGWHMCDGTMGTPDLRDKFVICAKQDDVGVAKAMIAGALSQSGGTKNHNHPFSGDGHGHAVIAGTDIASGSGYEASTSEDMVTGSTDTVYHFPECFALCYIMKL